MDNKKNLFDKCHMNKYYILVEEWNYPTESGRDVIPYTFDNKDEVLKFSEEYCDKEVENFYNNTHCDVLGPDYCPKGSNPNVEYGDEGYIITDKNGNEPYYYMVRIIEIDMIG